MKNVAVTNFYKAITKEMKKRKKKIQKEVPARFELTISCLLDRRYNQLSHGTFVILTQSNSEIKLKIGFK